MSVPDKLLEAAAEDIAVWLRVHAHEGWTADQEPVRMLAWKVATAVLAGLSDCEEWSRIVAGDVAFAIETVENPRVEGHELAWARFVTAEVFAALARMANP